MAQQLLKKGYKKVFALKGGWNEWLASEYPMEKRDPLPEEQEAGESGEVSEPDEETEGSETDEESDDSREEASDTAE